MPIALLQGNNMKAFSNLSEFVKYTGKNVGSVIRIRAKKNPEQICDYLITGFNHIKNVIDLGITAVTLEGLAQFYEYKDNTGTWLPFGIHNKGHQFKAGGKYKFMLSDKYHPIVTILDIYPEEECKYAVLRYKYPGTNVIATYAIETDGNEEYIALDEEGDLNLWAKDIVHIDFGTDY